MQLRSKVYIPIEGVRAGQDGKFTVSADNPTFKLLRAVDEEFLRSATKSTLLLAGPAGSGKSTFITELELLIGFLKNYARKKRLLNITAGK